MKQETAKRSLRKKVSYKHEAAIQTLRLWFEPEYIVEIDMPFFIDDKLIFVPDITLYQETTVRAFYEVVHKHGLTGFKLGKIQSWCYRNYDVPVYEVNADWVLNQTEKPERILSDKFETVTSPYLPPKYKSKPQKERVLKPIKQTIKI